MDHKIALEQADLQTGLNLSIARQRYEAAAQAMQMAEAEFIAALRLRLGLDERWVLRDWLRGFEEVGDGNDNV